MAGCDLHTVRSLTIFMMSLSPKLIYRFNETPIKMPEVFEIYKMKLRGHIATQRTQNSQNNFEKEKQS